MMLRQKRLSGCGCLALGLLGLCVGACRSDPLVHDRFAQIRPHACTQSEVASLIGEPTHRLGTMWMYDRPEQHLYVKIEFDKNGGVVRKEWIDAGHEVWEDSDAAPTGPGR